MQNGTVMVGQSTSSINTLHIDGVRLTDPDRTFYETVKGVSLTEQVVRDLLPVSLPAPRNLRLSSVLVHAWEVFHAPLIEAAWENKIGQEPYRSLFPGPYIPTLNGHMECIGDFSYTVFEHILSTVKQRIPQPRRIILEKQKYSYVSDYRPLMRKIVEPEEGWAYQKIVCPAIQGVNFPLPPSYEFEPHDQKGLHIALSQVQKLCQEFCMTKIGKGKKRSQADCAKVLTYITAVEYLCRVPVSALLVRAFDEVLTHFDSFNAAPVNPALFLFEVVHALSYLVAIRDVSIIYSGPYATYWIDILQLPLESLVETELCDVERVLREIRTFFSLGWAPIVVHLDKRLGYNTDGTHRHYAFLTIELLRRLKKANRNCAIRTLDINSQASYRVIDEFRQRYKKNGLSLRETLRVVNRLVNSDDPWPYLDQLEIELENVLDSELAYIPVIYLPEWRARSVVKNLCDKGIALVGVPPENIYIVGKSRGKKGIFIRGGYHGTDRQPMMWMNYIDIQKL